VMTNHTLHEDDIGEGVSDGALVGRLRGRDASGSLAGRARLDDRRLLHCACGRAGRDEAEGQEEPSAHAASID